MIAARIAIVAVAVIGFAAAVHLLTERSRPPQYVTPAPDLDGCPRVGGGYTHDGRWLACYACLGETPVCLLLEVQR